MGMTNRQEVEVYFTENPRINEAFQVSEKKPILTLSAIFINNKGTGCRMDLAVGRKMLKLNTLSRTHMVSMNPHSLCCVI
jgi:hypothetical protein